MATNAEHQRRWRDKCNALAKEALRLRALEILRAAWACDPAIDVEAEIARLRQGLGEIFNRKFHDDHKPGLPALR